MNAQERESVRVSLSVADNAYRKGAAQGKREAATLHYYVPVKKNP